MLIYYNIIILYIGKLKIWLEQPVPKLFYVWMSTKKMIFIKLFYSSDSHVPPSWPLRILRIGKLALTFFFPYKYIIKTNNIHQWLYIDEYYKYYNTKASFDMRVLKIHCFSTLAKCGSFEQWDVRQMASSYFEILWG